MDHVSEKVRCVLADARARSQALRADIASAERRLDATQRRRLVGQSIDALRDEIEALQRRVVELEPSVVEHQRALARLEHLRGEVAAHRDFQSSLDRAESELRSLRLAAEEAQDVIDVAERLESGGNA